MARKLNRHAWHVQPIERDERFHPHIEAAVRVGYGIPCVYGPLETYEEADDARRGMGRARDHKKVSGTAFVEELSNGTFQVRYTVWDKAAATEYIRSQGRYTGKN